MKKLILLLLFPLASSGQRVISVAAGGSIANACAAAVAGDKVVVAAGTYTERIHLKPGVSLIGAGVGKTIINNFTFDWWRGAIDLAGGDLAGAYPNPTVARIRGKVVTATAPTDGQVMGYDQTTDTIVWQNPATSPGVFVATAEWLATR